MYSLACRYDNPMPELTLSSSQGSMSSTLLLLASRAGRKNGEQADIGTVGQSKKKLPDRRKVSWTLSISALKSQMGEKEQNKRHTRQVNTRF
jgi:hypothetical protein